MKERLLVLAVGLAVTFVPPFLGIMGWLARAYRVRFAILGTAAFAAVLLGIWLVRSGRSAALRRNLPRCAAAMIGLLALSLTGLHAPGDGFLWSPLPWEPRAFHLARQKLFWVVGPLVYGLGFWLLDLVRNRSLRFTDRRLTIPLVVLTVLLVVAHLIDSHFYSTLDHGQGG